MITAFRHCLWPCIVPKLGRAVFDAGVLNSLQQLTFVQCPLSVTVHSTPYAHYLIWISWQHHNLSLIIILHMRKLRQVDQAVRSSDQTQVVWFRNIYSLLISPKLPLSPHQIPAVGVFDGAKLLLFNFLGWSICLSKCVTTCKYKVLHRKNTSFIPGDGCPICIAYRMMSRTS